MEKRVKWIVENVTGSLDYTDLIGAIKESNRFCSIIDHRNKFKFNPEGFEPKDCVIVLGSIQLTKTIASQLPANCFPISYASFSNYKCSSYYSKLQSVLFNNQHEFTTIKYLKENRFEFYEKFGREAVIFVRPDSGEKPFQAQLLDLQDFDKFWEKEEQDGTDIIIIATPKSILGEFRIVCSDKGEIIATTTYQYQGQRTLIPNVPTGALQKCEEVFKLGYFPDPIFCIDIFQDTNRKFWVGELTSFSSAGLYATNKKLLVSRVNDIVEQAYAQREM